MISKFFLFGQVIIYQLKTTQILIYSRNYTSNLNKPNTTHRSSWCINPHCKCLCGKKNLQKKEKKKKEAYRSKITIVTQLN